MSAVTDREMWRKDRVGDVVGVSPRGRRPIQLGSEARLLEDARPNGFTHPDKANVVDQDRRWRSSSSDEHTLVDLGVLDVE